MLSSKKLSEEANHQPRILYLEEIRCKKEGEAKTCSGTQNLERAPYEQTCFQKGKRNMFQISSGSGMEILESKKSGNYVDKSQ